jgi:tRNA (Thr-GGU) A37 N-methylase
LTIARVIKCEGQCLFIEGLDAVDGTPVLDIKLVFGELFLPRETIRQPQWSQELMKEYWKSVG